MADRPKPTIAIIKAAVMEFVLMMMFVFIGCGCAVVLTEVWPMLLKKNSAIDKVTGQVLDVEDVAQADYHSFLSFNAILPIAMCFGHVPKPSSGTDSWFTITALIYMSAHISGGQINCCVTLALALVGQLTPQEAAANTLAQTLGSVVGAALVQGLVPYGHSSALGSNSVASGIGRGETFLGEMLMTSLLVFAVLECCVNKAGTAGNNAPLVIGLTVMLGHLVLIPMDGCSINPTRSFGPALLANQWAGFWIFLFAPYIGTVLAVGMHKFFLADALWEYQNMSSIPQLDMDQSPHIPVNVELNSRDKIRAPGRA